MKQRSLSYAELFAMGPEEIEALEPLAVAGLLDDATLERFVHLGRFFTRLGKLVPADKNPGDELTEAELQAIWRETADPCASDDDIGHSPALH
jgi:hypothetical protein